MFGQNMKIPAIVSSKQTALLHTLLLLQARLLRPERLQRLFCMLNWLPRELLCIFIHYHSQPRTRGLMYEPGLEWWGIFLIVSKRIKMYLNKYEPIQNIWECIQMYLNIFESIPAHLNISQWSFDTPDTPGCASALF